MKKKTIVFIVAAMALLVFLLAIGLYLSEKSSEHAQEDAVNEDHLKMAQAIPLSEYSDEIPAAIEELLISTAYIGEDDMILTVKDLMISSMVDMELSSQEKEQICLKLNEECNLSIEPENIILSHNKVELEYSAGSIKYHYSVYAHGLVFKEVSRLFWGVEYSVANKNNEMLASFDSRNYGPHISIYGFGVNQQQNKVLYFIFQICSELF